MISVAIAAYNGEKYIAEQINSILSQLGDNDEIVVSDDYPQGNTRQVVNDIILKDNRVRYVEGRGQGVIKNFENAINNSKGEYIFLSDQDDVWLDGKVEAVMKAFAEGADVVMHDAIVTDASLNPTDLTAFKINHAGKGILKNVIRNSYQGSCMAFRADFAKKFLPFPDNLPMHDQWIGLIGEKFGNVHLINNPYIYYRRHGNNVSGNGSTVVQKIKWRIDIIGCLLRK